VLQDLNLKSRLDSTGLQTKPPNDGGGTGSLLYSLHEGVKEEFNTPKPDLEKLLPLEILTGSPKTALDSKPVKPLQNSAGF